MADVGFSMSCLIGKFGKIALLCDNLGAPRLLRHVPQENVACIVAAEIRPQYLNMLKSLAKKHDVPLVVQRKNSCLSLKGADSILCDSYSMRVPETTLLDLSGRAVNIHFSLLPENRGPNPVQWAIIHNDPFTGVTAHQMAATFDSGPIIDQTKVSVAMDDTWVLLFSRLNHVAERLLAHVVPDLLDGKAVCTVQDESQATRNTRLTPESPRIDFRTMTDLQVYNWIRAQVAPLQGAYLEENGERLRFPRYLGFEGVASMRKAFSKGGLAAVRKLELS